MKLTNTEWAYLTTIRARGSMTKRELELDMYGGRRGVTATRVIKRLKARGLLIEDGIPRGGRAAAWTLTEQGRRALEGEASHAIA